MDQCGYVVARKSDYYSPLPSRRGMQSTMARWTRPSSLLGVEYDLAEMKIKLTNLIRRYHGEFMDLLPYEQDLYDDAGILQTQVIYGAYQEFAGVQYPSKITMKRPQEEYQLVMTVERVNLNTPLSDDQFHVTIPSGTPIVQLH